MLLSGAFLVGVFSKDLLSEFCKLHFEGSLIDFRSKYACSFLQNHWHASELLYFSVGFATFFGVREESSVPHSFDSTW